LQDRTLPFSLLASAPWSASFAAIDPAAFGISEDWSKSQHLRNTYTVVLFVVLVGGDERHQAFKSLGMFADAFL
jgi:hypothetical protein